VYLPIYLGFGLFYTFLVVGQMAAAVVADVNGWGVAGGQKIPLKWTRGLALFLAVVGCLLSVMDSLHVSSPFEYTLLYCVIALAIGSTSTTQSLLNRQAAALLPSKFQACWWSFSTGLVAAGVVFCVHVAISGGGSALERTIHGASLRWELFTGGPLGIVFVAGAIFIPEILGSSAHTVAVISGNLLSSALTDHFGAFDFKPRLLTPTRIAGVLLVIFSAALMQWPSECRRRPLEPQPLGDLKPLTESSPTSS